MLLMLTWMALAFTPVKEKPYPLFETKWTLQQLQQGDTMVAVTAKKAFIIFDAERQSAHGNGGCNVFGSTFTIEENRIHLAAPFSTRMYCTDTQGIEDSFLQQLPVVDRYEITGDTLRMYKGDTLLLGFVAE